MAKLPEHGTMRRYRSGCGCDKCRAKNAEEKAKARERKRIREGKSAPLTGTVVHVPTPPRDHADDDASGGPSFTYEPGFEASVHGQLEAALREIEDTTALVSFRKTHALQLARVLDDLTKPHLWSNITKSLHEVLSLLIVNAGGKAGEGSPEADLLAHFMATHGPASRG